jgi:hypothetical protein
MLRRGGTTLMLRRGGTTCGTALMLRRGGTTLMLRRGGTTWRRRRCSVRGCWRCSSGNIDWLLIRDWRLPSAPTDERRSRARIDVQRRGNWKSFRLSRSGISPRVRRRVGRRHFRKLRN